MALSTDLINQFVKATKDTDKRKSESTIYGTVVVQGNTKYVRPDGSDLLTPASSAVTAKDGERVTILIKDHTATITGNITSPAARIGDVEAVDNKVIECQRLVADKANISDLTAERARIDTLVADNVTIKERITASEADVSTIKTDNATINRKLTANEADITNLKTASSDVTGRLTAAEGKIGTLESDNVTINSKLTANEADIGTLKTDSADVKGRLTAAEGNIGTLTSDNVTIKNKMTAAEGKIGTLESDNVTINEKLTAAEGNIGTLTSDNVTIKNKLTAVEGDITTLKSTQITTDILDASYAKIDLANVNNAWIQNGVIKDGSIGSATIHDGAVTNAKIADATIEAAKIKSINADVISAGTIKTARLIITDDEGNESIVKAINLANGIAEADVNSKKIQAASIDVADLSAFEATIAQFSVSENAIYSGKTTIKDPTSGIYISTTGIGMGDGSLTGRDESPLQAYADGSFKLVGKNSEITFNTVTGDLDIDASSIKVGSKAVITDGNIEDFENRLTSAETSIENNAKEIALRSYQRETAVIDNNLNAYIDRSTSMIQSISGWQYNWNRLIRTDEADIENHSEYITFNNGDIILGESGGDLKVKISNDAIQFKGISVEDITPDPDATAWITGEKFNINEGEIHNSLKIGKLQFLPRPNGNFALSII